VCRRGGARRLSRELHDELGQVLTALRIKLEVLGGELGAGSSAGRAARAHLDGALELAGRALTETRQLSRLLRPSVLDDLGLGPRCSGWRACARTIGLAVGSTVASRDALDPGRDGRLSGAGVADQRRQARRRERCAVEIAPVGARLALRISDPGRGFDVALAARPTSGTGGGSGLRGMRDRVELFGGRLEVRSAPGAGTVVEAELPVELAAGGGDA
jgi:signal transduction histidine kinase